MIGLKFDRWKVLKETPNRQSGGSIVYECLCECSTQSQVTGASLRSGNSKSCGCYMNEAAAKRFTTHGLSRAPIYRSYSMMKQRCTNPKTTGYESYGGRGIKICDRWLESFENFYTDMGERPIGLTLDRKDNDGDYTPDNCKWSTRAEQNKNKRY